MKIRIYAVTEQHGDTQQHHLVRAASALQAVKFVQKDRFVASIPTPDQLVQLTLAGVQVVEAA